MTSKLPLGTHVLVLAVLAFAAVAPVRGETARPATGPVTTDAEIIAALNLDLAGLEKVKAAVSRNDLPAAKQAYLDYRRTASPARWKVMPADEPAAVATDDADADRVCAHQVQNRFYFFLPKWIDMGKDFNWTFNPLPPTDPRFTPEVPYGIARTYFWNSLAEGYWKTHDEKYARAWVEQFRDFVAKNPVPPDKVDMFSAPNNRPILWRSLDISIRMYESWPTAYYHFLNSPAFTPADQWLYLKLIREHGVRLRLGLDETQRTGNWVSSECYGLYALAVLFPELRESAAWRDFAVARITSELDRMVPADGMEAELTPGYHMETVKEFRGPVDLAQLNHLPIPEVFRTKLLSMYRAVVTVMDQSGQDVPTNDSWHIDARAEAKKGLQLGDDPLLQWAASDGATGTALPDSTMLPYAGFYAMRGGWKPDDLFLFFRAGPPGIGHQHEDKLEVVLRAWNQTLLFDSGKYQYDGTDWRRFSIGTASHNTIIVDGKWQRQGANKPPVTEPVHNPWVTTPLFDYVAGTYDAGYEEWSTVHPAKTGGEKAERDRSVSHTRRVLFLRPYYALIFDTLDGTGNHTFDAHFNLDAVSARVDQQTQAAFSECSGKTQLALYPLERDGLVVDVVKGQKDPLLGWFLTEKEIRPIPTVRFRKQQAAPAIFATFLYPYRGAMPPVFAGAPLATTGEGVWGQSLTTPREKTEIVIAKASDAKTFSFKSALAGSVTATAAGIVIRQPAAGTPIIGGWTLTSYHDTGTQFTVDAPADLVVDAKGDHLLFFNGGAQSVKVALVAPFAQTATLAPRAWTSVSRSGAHAASPPSLFGSLEASVP